MKRFTRFFAVTLGLGLVLGGLAAVANHQFKNSFAQAEATNDPEDIAEFTNNGQFTYTISNGTGEMLSASEVAAEGIIDSGYDGAVYKATGANHYVKFNFAGSYIKVNDIKSINFKVYAYDSSATQFDLRIRKDVSSLVVNEASAGHSLLDVRNTWFTYEFNLSKFILGNSFANFANGEGYLEYFEVFFRTSNTVTVYFDSVTVDMLGDYGLATISDVNPSFVNPTTTNTVTTHIVLNNMSPFTGNSIRVKFGLRVASGVNIEVNFRAFGSWENDFYELKINANGDAAKNANARIFYKKAQTDITYNITLLKDADNIIEFSSIVLDSSHVYLETRVNDTVAISAVKEYAAGDLGRIILLQYYQAAANDVTAFDVDVKADALQRFGQRQLSSKTVAFDDNSETGACLTKYGEAKAFYNSYLTASQKIEFATSDTYAQLRARMVAWAAANGVELSFNPSTGALVESSNRIVPFVDKRSNAVLIVAISTVAISVAGFVVLFILKKKKATR